MCVVRAWKTLAITLKTLAGGSMTQRKSKPKKSTICTSSIAHIYVLPYYFCLRQWQYISNNIQQNVHLKNLYTSVQGVVGWPTYVPLKHENMYYYVVEPLYKKHHKHKT